MQCRLKCTDGEMVSMKARPRFPWRTGTCSLTGPDAALRLLSKDTALLTEGFSDICVRRPPPSLLCERPLPWKGRCIRRRCPLGGGEDASLRARLPAEGPVVCGADVAPSQAHGEGAWAGHGRVGRNGAQSPLLMPTSESLPSKVRC